MECRRIRTAGIAYLCGHISITAMKKLLITLSAILLLPVSSFSKVPTAMTGEQADSVFSVNGLVIDLLTLLFPEESYEFIEKTDAIIGTVRAAKG